MDVIAKNSICAEVAVGKKTVSAGCCSGNFVSLKADEKSTVNTVSEDFASKVSDDVAVKVTSAWTSQCECG